MSKIFSNYSRYSVMPERQEVYSSHINMRNQFTEILYPSIGHLLSPNAPENPKKPIAV